MSESEGGMTWEELCKIADKWGYLCEMRSSGNEYLYKPYEKYDYPILFNNDGSIVIELLDIDGVSKYNHVLWDNLAIENIHKIMSALEG